MIIVIRQKRIRINMFFNLFIIIVFLIVYLNIYSIIFRLYICDITARQVRVSTVNNTTKSARIYGL